MGAGRRRRSGIRCVTGRAGRLQDAPPLTLRRFAVLTRPAPAPRSGIYRSESTVNTGHRRDSQAAKRPRDGFRETPERPRWTLRLTIYAEASARSSNSTYASRTRSRMRSWAAVSAIGRRSAKLRRSPLTAY